MNPKPIRAHFLGQRIQQIHNLTDASEDLVVIFESIERFQKEIQDCRNRAEALALLQNYVQAMNLFHETAFHMVTEDHSFALELCSNPTSAPTLEAFLKTQMREGRFAWALQQNRPMIVDAHHAMGDRQVLLHGMGTRLSAMGMFVGILREEKTLVRSAMMRLISILIDATVFVLENQMLQAELREHNRKLEATVEARTHELRQANQQLYQGNIELKRLNEVKSEFLGIAAHDLKNPLSAILGFTQIVGFSLEHARDGSPMDYDEALLMLNQVESSVSHMVQVIHELIDSESMESGHMRINPEWVDAGMLARKVVALNQSNAISKSIEIEFQTDPDLHIHADPLRIHEAMDNLISNAIKYSPFNSKIQVTLESNNNSDKTPTLLFSVRDQGPGLTDTDKSKLFHRFQKLSARPTAGENSTGLGLSIVKSIVELHKGKVWADSEAGKGATFRFTLPRAASPRAGDSTRFSDTNPL